MADVRVGLERALADCRHLLAGRRFGLLLNQASVDRRFRLAHRLLARSFPGGLVALFSPQHGLWSEEQDDMIESVDRRDAELGVVVHSLYGERREPSDEALAGLDALVVDLQDVGTRVYTYIWTLSLCIERCAALGVEVVVLDRPNPLGGELVEGPLLDEAYASFVGRAPIPMAHGLTIGELGRWLARRVGPRARLSVVPMDAWSRELRWPRTGRDWVPPSPNLPRWEGALVYPGTVLLEGTNVSEGRGTTTPFEILGAPWIDGARLRRELESFELPGVVFRDLRFKPTFHKWAEEECGGVFIHVTDPRAFRPYRTGVSILAAVRRAWPESFCWRPPPYEYETRRPPIDVISGGRALRETVDAGGALDAALELDTGRWWDAVEEDLLYPRRLP